MPQLGSRRQCNLGRLPTGAGMLLMIALSLSLTSAYGGDEWSVPAPGVRYLHRTGGGQNIHVLVVDLKHPEVAVRAILKNTG